MNAAKCTGKVLTQMQWSEHMRAAFSVLLSLEGADKSTILKSNNNIIRRYWYICIILLLFSFSTQSI